MNCFKEKKMKKWGGEIFLKMLFSFTRSGKTYKLEMPNIIPEPEFHFISYLLKSPSRVFFVVFF